MKRRRPAGAAREPDVSEASVEPWGEDDLAHEFRIEDALLTDVPAAADAAGGRISRSLLTGAGLAGARLRSLSMSDVIVRGADASNADLTGAELERVRFADCRMTGVALPESSMRDVVFSNCKLNLANLRAARMERVTFEDCVLDEADLGGATIADTRFSGCQIRRVPFDHARLLRADFRGSELVPFGDALALRGAIVDPLQLIDLAGPLAASAGIVVEDRGDTP
jgi:uncharacterized protein YjbI with pentapeptide repeats